MGAEMIEKLGALAVVSGLAMAMFAVAPASAQKPGGILRLAHFDSPASMSILEESTRAALQPMMGVFNNLVMYDQHIAKSSLETVVPDLATSWSWSEDGTELTFPLRQDVKWHDGKPFTAADVKCTWDLLMGTGSDKLRVNPRKSWYDNVAEVGTPGELEGTFKFIEFKPNEYIKVAKNPDYWKPGRPYLDGIEYTIMREAGPRNLAFFAGKFDMIPLNVSIPTLKDFKAQAPRAICEVQTGNLPRTLLVNPTAPPFDNPELRKAMGLAFDRQAFLVILNQGKGAIGANMMPPPDGDWGMPPEVLQTLPGYGPNVEKNRAEARKIMEKLGYGPDKRLAITLSTRNFPAWRNPAVIMISHLKEIYIDAELDLVDTARWYGKMARKDYTVGAVPIESGVDDPDQMFFENYLCGAVRNYGGYCNPELDKLINQQSMEANPVKRKDIVWQIERILAEAEVRPVLFYPAIASCWEPWVKGLTLMTNSIFNGWRMEDVWLDK